MVNLEEIKVVLTILLALYILPFCLGCLMAYWFFKG